jgi:hypothetical protein
MVEFRTVQTVSLWLNNRNAERTSIVNRKLTLCLCELSARRCKLCLRG